MDLDKLILKLLWNKKHGIMLRKTLRKKNSQTLKHYETSVINDHTGA